MSVVFILGDVSLLFFFIHHTINITDPTSPLITDSRTTHLDAANRILHQPRPRTMQRSFRHAHVGHAYLAITYCWGVLFI